MATPKPRRGKRQSAANFQATLFPDAFDFIANRIDLITQGANPHLPDPVLAGADRTKAIERSVRYQMNHIPRLLKSGFTAAAGRVFKRKPPVAAEQHDPQPSPRQSKRLRSTSPSPNSIHTRAETHISSMNHTFTEDSLAPMHKPIPLSVESSPYRRMPSRDIARLSVNDEIILMIPEVNVNTSP